MEQDSDHDSTCTKLATQLNAMKKASCSRQQYTHVQGDPTSGARFIKELGQHQHGNQMYYMQAYQYPQYLIPCLC